MKSNSFLETEKVTTLMKKYAIPCVISLLVAALYNIVDQIFIANASYLGSYGNAANTVVYPLTVVALAIAVMIGDGCCAHVSILLGANKKEDANKSVGNSVLLCIIASIIVLLVYLILQDPILTLFGGKVNETTYQLSKEYFFWITVGVPFYMFGQCMNPIIRSDGSPKFAMGCTLAGAVINIILDPIFIFIFKWGMMGAAVATILGQIFTAIVSIWYMMHMKTVTLTRNSFNFFPYLMKRFIPLGGSSFLSQISLVFSMAAMQNMVVKYSAFDAVFSQAEYAQIPMAVLGIVMKFFQIVISISVGMAAGCIPVVGYNMGAGRKDRVKDLFKALLIGETVLGCIAFLIVEFLPGSLIQIFGAANESAYYTQFAIKCFRVYLCMVIFATVNKGTFIYLQAMGKALMSTALSMIREIVFGVGFALLLPIFFGLNGVLYSMPVSDILTFVASVIVIVATMKTLSEQETTPEAVMQTSNASTSSPLCNTIIAIGRSYGAGGRTIGKEVAEKLHIPYYHEELQDQLAAEFGFSKKAIAQWDEKAVSGNMYGFTDSSSLEISKAEQELINRIADNGPCVFIGRRADQILKNRNNVLSVFISASEDNRVQRIMERDHLSEQKSLQKIHKVDSERANFYNQVSKHDWGDANTYDLCIDTDKIGIDGAVETILHSIQYLEAKRA